MSIPWRKIEPAPYSLWQAVISRAGGPDELASRAAWEAAGNLSGLCLAMLAVESQFGTEFARNPVTSKNALNLRPRHGLPGFESFDSWADGIDEYRDRLTDPDYAYAHTVTLEDLIHVFAPSSDGNNEREYVATIERLLDEWGLEEKPQMPETTVTFGRVPKPPILDLIVSKIGDGHGYTRLSAPRQNVGICEHITDGHGSIEWYRSFFGIGGEREADALVDFIVGRDGRIGMLNDWRGTRAPWANGNLLGQEGDGPAFIAKFGTAGVNNRLVSIEHEGFAYEDWPGAMWNAAVALDAWLFDQMGVRYDSFPVHQDHGVVTHVLHSEFTNKGGNALDECPGRYLKRNIDAFQSDIKALMMAHQITSPVTEFADPAPITWNEGDVGDRDLNGTPALAFLLEVEVIRKAIQPQVSDTDDRPTGIPRKKRTRLRAIGSYRGQDRNGWLVLRDGSRIKRSDVRPLPPLPKAA